MAFFTWSRSSASNGNSDGTINFLEGQAPSTLNDSARAVMARLREFADDIAGAIVTGGSSTAYTVASYEGFDTLAHLSGQVIAFTPHTTNGATVTLSVDGTGAKPLRTSPGVELQSGVLVQGTPYTALYNNSDGAFYLSGIGTAPGVPLGSSFDYWGTTAPSTFFALSFGQAISRTTYATLFSLCGTTYGTGDGSTTFNIPDLRGRVVPGKDDMGGSAANRLTSGGSGITGTTLGASGGTETKTLLTANLPPYTPSGSIAMTTASGGTTPASVPNGQTPVGFTTGSGNAAYITANFFALIATFTGTAQGGTSTPVPIVPPAIVANKLLRII